MLKVSKKRIIVGAHDIYIYARLSFSTNGSKWWGCGCDRVSEWVRDCMDEWMNGCVNGWYMHHIIDTICSAILTLSGKSFIATFNVTLWLRTPPFLLFHILFTHWKIVYMQYGKFRYKSVGNGVRVRAASPSRMCTVKNVEELRGEIEIKLQFFFQWMCLP